MADHPVYVAVIGGSEFEAKAAEDAKTVGRLLAEAGAVVLCGGGTGVMEAVCDGCKHAGGTTIGFLPGDDRGHANEYVDFALPTGLGEMRNMLVVTAADVVIAVSGEFGTLSEIAFALRIGKRIIGVSTWELAKGGEKSTAIEVADTPADAVRRALEIASA